ncbi:MAG: hypothetical protein MESAZ_02307 [Saezia sanguinis]
MLNTGQMINESMRLSIAVAILHSSLKQNLSPACFSAPAALYYQPRLAAYSSRPLCEPLAANAIPLAQYS